MQHARELMWNCYGILFVKCKERMPCGCLDTHIRHYWNEFLSARVGINEHGRQLLNCEKTGMF